LEKTIAELHQETGIASRTFYLAATEGRIPARRAGTTWLIDVANPLYQDFLTKHQAWIDVRGKEKKGD